MGRDELRVEQAEAALREPCGEMDKGDFGRIGCAMKHAFAEEGGAEMNAVKPARKRAIRPALDRVDPANVEELAVEPFDPFVNPGLLSALAGSGATVDYGVKILVNPDLELVGANRLCKALRYDEGVERKNAALLWVDPEQVWVLGAFRHWK